MKRNYYLTLASVAALLLCSSTALRAQINREDSTKREALSVTIYNDNLGVVRDVRKFDINNGSSEIKMRDVPAEIDPTTVKITARNHPKDLVVSEQNYEYDLVSQQKLLEKYIDHTITVVDDKGIKTEGTLLSLEADKLTIRTASGITMLPNLTRYTIDVPSLPAGLITQPTLVWRIDASRSLSGEPLEVLYQTHGLNWHAEYIAALSEDDKSLDLTGWVSLENTSGATYPNAKLKLIAGAVHRAPQQQNYAKSRAGAFAISEVELQFAEHAMFEYHVYDLQHPTTLKNNEVKQVSLLEANGVASSKHYTYTGGRNVDVTIDFVNTEANHLGTPIPMGKVRVMKRDKDGSLEFVGEDNVEHTPRDEKITLKVGEAFDLVGTRTATDSRNLGSNSQTETFEIVLKNRKDENVTIDVLENVGESWDITKSSMDYEKKSASEIIFHVPVKARSEQTLTYTVIHHW
jgi:hypothetical protein